MSRVSQRAGALSDSGMEASIALTKPESRRLLSNILLIATDPHSSISIETVRTPHARIMESVGI